MDQLKQAVSTLDRELGKIPLMLHLERQSGIPKAHLFLALVGGLLSFLLSLFIPDLLLSLLLLAYPLFRTIQAIDGMSRVEHVQWLSYWSIQAIIILVEQLTFGKLVRVLPHYYWVKAAFSVWLWMPSTMAATRIYELAVRPAISLIKDHTGGASGQRVGTVRKPEVKPSPSPLLKKTPTPVAPIEITEEKKEAAEEEEEADKDK